MAQAAQREEYDLREAGLVWLALRRPADVLASGVEPGHFAHPLLGSAWGRLAAAWREGRRLSFPELALAEPRLRVIEQAIVDASLVDGTDPALLVGAVLDEAARRRLATELSTLAVQPDLDRLSAIVAREQARMARPIGDAHQAIAELFAAPPPSAEPWGVDWMDGLVGGLRPGSVYGLAASTGKGKTAMAVQLATALARSRPVLYVATELSRRQIYARVLAQATGRGWAEMLAGGPELIPVLQEHVPAGLYAHEWTATDTVEALVAGVTEAAGRAPVLVVDYIQDVARPTAVAQRVDMRLAVGDVMRRIREWARRTSGAALVVSSVGRQHYRADGKEGGPDALVGTAKEAGEIEYDVAGLLHLLVDDEVDELGARRAVLTLAKSRYSVTGRCGLRFFGAQGRFVADEGALDDDEDRDADQRILAALRTGTVDTVRGLAEAAEMRRQTAADRLRVLRARGVVRGFEVVA